MKGRAVMRIYLGSSKGSIGTPVLPLGSGMSNIIDMVGAISRILVSR
jgi:hypothetical protein